MKESRLAALLLIIAAASLLCWGLGVASDFFRNPAFSAFWWLNYPDAHNAIFIAITIGGAVLMFGIGFIPFHKTR